MAEAPYRDLRKNLHEGLTDGAYKKMVTDRGGVVEAVNVTRKLGMPKIYEIEEAPVKMLPSGMTVDLDGNTVSTPAPAVVAPGVAG